MPRRLNSLRNWIGMLAIVSAFVGLRNDFGYDDILLLPHDPRMRGSASGVRFHATEHWPAPYAADPYCPFASLLMAIEYAVGAGSPLVFRIVSVLLNVAASIGVFRVASRITSERAA